jgi:kynurenine formamidase
VRVAFQRIARGDPYPSLAAASFAGSRCAECRFCDLHTPQFTISIAAHAIRATSRAAACDAARMRRIDLSHPIEAGMTTYPGLPAPRAEVLLDYDASRAKYRDGVEFLIASLHLCGNTGTYVDAPIHRWRDAADLAALPLERLAHVRVTVVDARGRRAIDAQALTGLPIEGRAVLVHTGFSASWRTPAYGVNNPHLTADACALLVERGAAIVGIDSVNVDAIEDLARPAHTALLRAGIPICEHMTNLAAVPAHGAFFHAAPIPWVGGATFPVRAYVVTSDRYR